MICSMILPRFELERPASLPQACALLSTHSAETALLAGGTDLLVKMKRQEKKPRLVISLGRIDELRGCEADKGGWSIGALCTMSELARDERLTGPWAGLAEGAAAVGGPLIRNRATVGGNIVNARPCADTVPALITLDAKLRLCGPNGERIVDLDGFITAPGATHIASDEVLAAILVPGVDGDAGSCYLKATRRAAMEVTAAGVAASLVLEDGKIKRARIVLSSVGPTPLRAPAAEDALVGQAPDVALIARAAELARDAATPLDDHRATAAYRRQVIEVLTRRALITAFGRATGRATGRAIGRSS
jgi:CO/xanthine dehydrogenase FAD-binding subunit